jgi:tetratricopeptide (TPR) repeat protein
MAFEKAKVLKAAEKFLSQGKINAAIKEYRQIVEHDYDDLTALNMLGDLLARAGDKDEAVACFSRIAEHYREQEFRLKAIAMYKKIEKLKPRDPETAAKLAELYSAQGLNVDARAQLLVVAEAHTREGKTKESLKVLHKIADLDPHNTDVRLKLAEGYLKEEMSREAAKAFSEAGSRMLEKGDLENSLDAYSRALTLFPRDIAVLHGLTAVHAALGSSDEAAELLEKALEDDPDDRELLDMLAQAYIEGKDAIGAERVIAQLRAADASDHRRYIEVVHLHLQLGNATEAARVLELIIEPMLSGREENDLLELVDKLLETEPEQVAGLRLLARVHWWQRDMEKLRSVLERLAESAESAGLVDEERYALTQLVRLAPDEQRFIDRLEVLGGSLEEIADAPQMNAEFSGESHSDDDFGMVGDRFGEVATADVTAETGSEFEWNSVAEVRTDASSSFADLNEPDTELDSEVQIFSNAFSARPSEPAFADTTESSADAELQPDEAGAARVQAMMQQELESVDFYITQGYSDIAIDTLELLERQFGSHPEIESRRARLAAGGEAVETSPVQVIITEPEFETAAEPQAEAAFEFIAEEISTIEPASMPAKSSGSGLDSGLAEIFEEFRLEAEGDDHASSQEDYETHYNMATAYKEMDLLDEAIREFQAAAALASPADGTARYFHCCNMLGHCFVQKSMPRAAVLWFKKGIDAPGRSADEYKAIQYELGAAFEQMGDLNQAVAAFTEVYGVDVDYRDIATRLGDLQSRQNHGESE